MNKQYIAPQMEVTTLGVLSVICASGSTPTSLGDFEIVNQDTYKQW